MSGDDILFDLKNLSGLVPDNTLAPTTMAEIGGANSTVSASSTGLFQSVKTGNMFEITTAGTAVAKASVIAAINADLQRKLSANVIFNMDSVTDVKLFIGVSNAGANIPGDGDDYFGLQFDDSIKAVAEIGECDGTVQTKTETGITLGTDVEYHIKLTSIEGDVSATASVEDADGNVLFGPTTFSTAPPGSGINMSFVVVIQEDAAAAKSCRIGWVWIQPTI